MHIETVTKSTGNVFTDLGFSREEAELLKMRTDLMIQLNDTSKRNQGTQAQVAEVFGVSQARVSDLTRGKWDKFSIDMLISLLIRAGKHCEVRVSQPKRSTRAYTSMVAMA